MAAPRFSRGILNLDSTIKGYIFSCHGSGKFRLLLNPDFVPSRDGLLSVAIPPATVPHGKRYGMNHTRKKFYVIFPAAIQHPGEYNAPFSFPPPLGAFQVLSSWTLRPKRTKAGGVEIHRR